MVIFHCYVSSPEGKTIWTLDDLGGLKVDWNVSFSIHHQSLVALKHSSTWRKGWFCGIRRRRQRWYHVVPEIGSARSRPCSAACHLAPLRHPGATGCCDAGFGFWSSNMVAWDLNFQSETGEHIYRIYEYIIIIWYYCILLPEGNQVLWRPWVWWRPVIWKWASEPLMAVLSLLGWRSAMIWVNYPLVN